MAATSVELGDPVTGPAVTHDQEDEMTARTSQSATPTLRSWPIRFALLALIWGLSFLFIKEGDSALAPLQVSFARILIGAITLLIIVAARGDRLPSGWRTWGHLAVAAVLLNAAPFSLFAYGEQHVSSVLAGIWNATAPLFTLPIAVLMIADERATLKRGLGLGVGFVGVLVVLGIWRGLGGASLEGNLLCLAAGACYGLGFPYARKYLAGRPEGPLALATGQLICGALELAIITAVVTHTPSSLPARVIASVVALGALGTGVAYILNYSIIRDVGATIASTVTYIVPIFSTLAGVLVLSEPLTWNEPVGAAVVILGAAITQDRLRRRSLRPRLGPTPDVREPAASEAHRLAHENPSVVVSSGDAP